MEAILVLILMLLQSVVQAVPFDILHPGVLPRDAAEVIYVERKEPNSAYYSRMMAPRLPEVYKGSRNNKDIGIFPLNYKDSEYTIRQRRKYPRIFSAKYQSPEVNERLPFGAQKRSVLSRVSSLRFGKRSDNQIKEYLLNNIQPEEEHGVNPAVFEKRGERLPSMMDRLIPLGRFGNRYPVNQALNPDSLVVVPIRDIKESVLLAEK